MEALATVGDLEARLGRTFADAELARVVSVLEDVSALVRDEAGVDWVDAVTGQLTAVPAAIRAVVLRAAERSIRNPGGFSSESTDGYSYQRVGVQDGVHLTDADIRLIRRATKRPGLWTQPTTRGFEGLDTVWFEDQFGTEPFPLDVRRRDGY